MGTRSVQKNGPFDCGLKLYLPEEKALPSTPCSRPKIRFISPPGMLGYYTGFAQKSGFDDK
jgi:hypothetical protein